jgi:hypothetical protein
MVLVRSLPVPLDEGGCRRTDADNQVSGCLVKRARKYSGERASDSSSLERASPAMVGDVNRHGDCRSVQHEWLAYSLRVEIARTNEAHPLGSAFAPNRQTSREKNKSAMAMRRMSNQAVMRAQHRSNYEACGVFYALIK